ncbi:MAG: methylated-DNA--[protein]-cysteine S-methyltransferase [Pirellulales bacterium]
MIGTVNRVNVTAGRSLRGRGRDQETHAAAFPTELGWMAIAWRDDVLQGIVFGHKSRRLAEAAIARLLQLRNQFFCFVEEGQDNDGPYRVRELVDALRQFADGDAVDFSDVPLALEHLTPFARRVVAACRRIYWGEVRTYGELAAECGSPGAARAVGSVMAKNRFPLIVPCHRVLAAGGELGGYSAPDGLRMKRRLLEMERGTARWLNEPSYERLARL